MINITRDLLVEHNACADQVVLFHKVFPSGFDSTSVNCIITAIERGLDVVWFSHTVLEGRWEEAEPFISMNATLARRYALNVIEGRWELGERSINRCHDNSKIYAEYLILYTDFEDYESLPENIKAKCFAYLNRGV
jgi:hypothetical protein